MTTNHQPDAQPPLPEAEAWVISLDCDMRGFIDAKAWKEDEFTTPLFTADQMRAYATEHAAKLHAECEALRFTRALAQARYENAVKLLTGIHELLYPAPVNTPDGRTLVFRPDDSDLHATLQLLSDRIRAIPKELEAAHSSAWWTYRTESKRQRDAARAAKEQSK